jgi:hypothetical protein
VSLPFQETTLLQSTRRIFSLSSLSAFRHSDTTNFLAFRIFKERSSVQWAAQDFFFMRCPLNAVVATPGLPTSDP